MYSEILQINQKAQDTIDNFFKITTTRERRYNFELRILTLFCYGFTWHQPSN